MSKRVLLPFFLLAGLICSGCVTGRSVVSVANLPVNVAATTATAGKGVYIRSVNDRRVFEATPSRPSTPSLDPDKPDGADIEARAFGRKRGGWGKSEGDVLFDVNQTAMGILKNRLEKAFSDAGYLIIRQTGRGVQPDLVVDVDVRKFWGWMTPNFLSATMSNLISTVITIEQGTASHILEVETYYSEVYAFGATSDWKDLVEKTLDLYVEDVGARVEHLSEAPQG